MAVKYDPIAKLAKHFTLSPLIESLIESGIYLPLVVSSTVLAGAIPLVVSAIRKRRLAFVYAIAFMSVVTWVVLNAFQVSFAGIHVAYAMLTWSVPIVGAVALVCVVWRRRYLAFKRSLAVSLVLMLPASFGIYATNVEPNRIVVDHFRDSLNTGRVGGDFRLVVLSDIQAEHVGDHEKRSARIAGEQNGDLILYAGDLISGEDDPLPRQTGAFVDLVKDMKSGYGSFFVAGDHDLARPLEEIVTVGGGMFLSNEVRTVDVRGVHVGVLGLENASNSSEAIAAMKSFAARSDLDYKIVLAHHPDVALFAPSGIDLMVGGHTHGGQVQLPFFGPVMTLSAIPRRQAAGGLFDYPGGNKLFVTRGIGVEHGEAPVVRFMDPPEVAVVSVSAP